MRTSRKHKCQSRKVDSAENTLETNVYNLSNDAELMKGAFADNDVILDCLITMGARGKEKKHYTTQNIATLLRSTLSSSIVVPEESALIAKTVFSGAKIHGRKSWVEKPYRL